MIFGKKCNGGKRKSGKNLTGVTAEKQPQMIFMLRWIRLPPAAVGGNVGAIDAL